MKVQSVSRIPTCFKSCPNHYVYLLKPYNIIRFWIHKIIWGSVPSVAFVQALDPTLVYVDLVTPSSVVYEIACNKLKDSFQVQWKLSVDYLNLHQADPYPLQLSMLPRQAYYEFLADFYVVRLFCHRRWCNWRFSENSAWFLHMSVFALYWVTGWLPPNLYDCGAIRCEHGSSFWFCNLFPPSLRVRNCGILICQAASYHVWIVTESMFLCLSIHV